MGKTLSLGLLGASFAALLSIGEAKGEVVFSQDFEAALCGALPKGLNDGWRKAHPTNEMCRYVTNLDAATGGKALLYDFSQLKPGSRIQQGDWHGWLSWWGDAKITNGWMRWSMSVKRLSGALKGEIRSEIGSRAELRMRRHCWIAYWLTFDEMFRVRCEAKGARTIAIGNLPRGRWCRIDLDLPLPGNASTNAYGCVSEKGHDGVFVPGPRVAIPLGDLRLLSGYHLMQIGGSGTAKWLVDDLSLTHFNERTETGWGSSCRPISADRAAFATMVRGCFRRRHRWAESGFAGWNADCFADAFFVPFSPVGREQSLFMRRP